MLSGSPMLKRSEGTAMSEMSPAPALLNTSVFLILVSVAATPRSKPNSPRGSAGVSGLYESRRSEILRHLVKNRPE